MKTTRRFLLFAAVAALFAGSCSPTRHVTDSATVQPALELEECDIENPGTSINELALNWATTRHSDKVDPLTPGEIHLLRQYLIVKD